MFYSSSFPFSLAQDPLPLRPHRTRTLQLILCFHTPVAPHADEVNSNPRCTESVCRRNLFKKTKSNCKQAVEQRFNFTAGNETVADVTLSDLERTTELADCEDDEVTGTKWGDHAQRAITAVKNILPSKDSVLSWLSKKKIEQVDPDEVTGPSLVEDTRV